ncbi:glycine cleavage system aminomethyltransferase GcvT [Alicyclobacillus acidocaldarius]|uniref:Aminomethyltransferase n=1 Tax=Alicyclobacillus acidocaldarius subsp. acidocaldarius (strain ATCC 27009 / DSM 446 / BCRC 14685 / JCM 5260 / KCTC 1825 / NBRC 15652 / NCIMB 11725 / NRRL B-14509 / 104-IA) TaxID=521098 RepID=C8WXJ1_ALIAD|nr:glycine cleavage system aminomethyltransferase GcvT [Alicyclobacillus acidocaldarius]ACV58812.1 glycine cleavage system T protein [Alicyclobacillus acidocaldarius subsp. acidocaldarius DSM 446]
MGKRTPLYDLHLRFGARMVEFSGWEMPVQYTSILDEHRAVRTDVGMFDVSHMGEIEVSGPDSFSFLQHLLTNDLARLRPGRALYTLMTDDRGGTLDDLLVYQLGDDRFWLVVNAANREADVAWLRDHIEGAGVTVTDRSDDVALLAVQGPRAADRLEQLGLLVGSLRPFSFTSARFQEGEIMVSRTGYTGEDGFELYTDGETARKLFEALQALGVTPCGLGARDTLRLEACLPLYGQELRRDVTPLEASLAPFVKFDKGDFIGREALLSQAEAGPSRRLVGVEMADRAIPRTGYAVFRGEQRVGEITSGTLSPTLERPIGLALVNASAAAVGETLEVEIRGKRHVARVVPIPFYRRPKVSSSSAKEE